jgi:MFS family permease
MSENLQSRIFAASCLALTVTAMTFAIRAGILSELSINFTLSDTQLGWINSMAFLGFPLATMLGGFIYNIMGPKKMMYIAFAGHMIGLVLTITASGFWGLLISSFCVGFANGSVEAACNPLIADMYHKNKVTMLNRFHVWFPGGIVIGALISAAMTKLGLGWQLQIAVILVPTVIYGYLTFSNTFPEMAHSEMSTSTNIRWLFSPLYLMMLFCMTLTATTELGTQQWIERILSNSGAHPMLILAMITGVMAVGRQFAGPVIHRLHPTGVLLASSVVAAGGIYFMSMASGPMVYAAALLFALGVMYFWPTMIGFVSEYLPKTGALGLSLIGGVGMFAAGWWQPVIGSWIDEARIAALANGVSPEEAGVAAGQAALANLALFPTALILLFGLLFFIMRKSGRTRGDSLQTNT